MKKVCRRANVQSVNGLICEGVIICIFIYNFIISCTSFHYIFLWRVKTVENQGSRKSWKINWKILSVTALYWSFVPKMPGDLKIKGLVLNYLIVYLTIINEFKRGIATGSCHCGPGSVSTGKLRDDSCKRQAKPFESDYNDQHIASHSWSDSLSPGMWARVYLWLAGCGFPPKTSWIDVLFLDD